MQTLVSVSAPKGCTIVLHVVGLHARESYKMGNKVLLGCTRKLVRKPGMELHDFNPILGRLRLENGEFKARASKTLSHKRKINK